ncbi:hypothetical protein C1646_776842 [Rhizophagus diaphanus]|nr:hypothetical protein C1646_776842 [Rhizophagus diaphanus] [Rhizophagus sp. MUCL 43196]
MVETGDCRFYKSVQATASGDPLWIQRKKNNFTSISVNNVNNSMGRLKPYLDVYVSSVQEMDSSKSNCIPQGELETSCAYYSSNATERGQTAYCNKFNVHCQEGEDCQIHVQCVSLLQGEDEEQICNQHKNGKYGDIVKFSKICTNTQRINDMQASIWELRKVCVLEDVNWAGEKYKAKPCNYVLPIHRNENNARDETMCILQKTSRRVESKGLGDDSSCMIVDTFVDESVHRNLASSISYDLPTNSTDPEKLGCYYRCVTKFGFNHIIVIGGLSCGLLFIDCYKRVFQWEDMEQVLWPVGNSLEDMIPYEDLVIWTVEDGVVYEESKVSSF